MYQNPIDVAPLVERATRNPVFRAELIEAPEAVVRRSQDLSEGVVLKVVEETSQRIYLVVPAHLPLFPNELSAAGRVAVRAATNRRYLEDLKEDPHAVLGAELGLTLPREIAIEVLEDSASRIHIVLPTAVDLGAEAPAPLHARNAPTDVTWGCDPGTKELDCTDVSFCSRNCSMVPCDPTEDQPTADYYCAF